MRRSLSKHWGRRRVESFFETFLTSKLEEMAVKSNPLNTYGKETALRHARYFELVLFRDEITSKSEET